MNNTSAHVMRNIANLIKQSQIVEGTCNRCQGKGYVPQLVGHDEDTGEPRWGDKDCPDCGGAGEESERDGPHLDRQSSMYEDDTTIDESGDVTEILYKIKYMIDGGMDSKELLQWINNAIDNNTTIDSREFDHSTMWSSLKKNGDVSIRLFNTITNGFSGGYLGFPTITPEDLTLGDIRKLFDKLGVEAFMTLPNFRRPMQYELQELLSIMK